MARDLARLLKHFMVVMLCAFLASCGGGGGGAGSSPLALPTLSAQPQAATIADGQTVTLNVTASGAASYQWLLNGAAVPGATQASYTTPALVYGTSYQYSVIASNAAGSITSQMVSISITPVAPMISMQPASATIADGTEVGFGVQVKGSQPLNYQWLRNGTAIAGANQSALALSPAQLSDSGASFTVQISNAVGSVTSQAAQLTVTPLPAQITASPVDQTVLDGAVASYAVQAVGSAPLSYQWQFNGKNIVGATSASHSFVAAYAQSGGQLSVVVSNAYASITSKVATLKVTPLAPSISAAPQSYTAGIGATVKFSEAAVGTQPMNYQWQVSRDDGLSWTDISGAASASYTIPAIALAHANNQYRVVISNAGGTVPSPAAVLMVNSNVQILGGTVGAMGYADGTGNGARLGWMAGMVSDADGNIILTESDNGVLRKVTRNGVVTTIAGKANRGSFEDGDLSTARFLTPTALARDAAGNLYVADTLQIRKLSVNGNVSTLAGGGLSSADGVGAEAGFSRIVGLAVNADGNLIVLDAGENQTVRLVTPEGKVSTWVGKAGHKDYVDGQAAEARFSDLRAVAVDRSGNVFVSDWSSIRKITPAGVVSLYAGLPGHSNLTNGPLLSARFIDPCALGFDAAGILYVGESNAIRMVSNGQVSTLAGGEMTNFPDVDGTPPNAVMNDLQSMTVLPSGEIAFGEYGSAIRIVDATGKITTLAGASAIGASNTDGPLSAKVGDPTPAATFRPTGSLAVDALGRTYVGTDYGLRRIDAQGSVQTIALPPVSPNGANCWQEFALAADTLGNVYMAVPKCQQVFKVSATGVVSVLAGQYVVSGSTDGPAAQATFNAPSGLAVDAAGNVFVSDLRNATIRRIDTSGSVTTFAGRPGTLGSEDGQGGAARFVGPKGMAIDDQGNLYVSDTSAFVIRKITPAAEVQTIAGSAHVVGVSSGAVTRFNAPDALAWDPATADLYISDTGNNLIQRLSTKNLRAYPVVGQTGVRTLQPGVGGAINQAKGIAVLPGGQILFTSELAILKD